jgi:hypothetical protein
MRPPAEGDVYRQQSHKHGFGEQASLVADLDRKKEDQAEERKPIQQVRAQDVDVGRVLGQSGTVVVPSPTRTVDDGAARGGVLRSLADHQL